MGCGRAWLPIIALVIAIVVGGSLLFSRAVPSMRAARTVVCFGASYTAGYWKGGSMLSPYCNALMLADGDKAIEYGLPGETSRAMTSRIHDVLADVPGEVHAVIVLGGTNDLGFGPDADTIFANMHAVVRAARARAPIVIWLTVPAFPNLLRFEAALSKQVALNHLIRGVREPGVTVVDLVAALPAESSSLWDADGLHPNASGYAAIAAAIDAQAGHLLTD